MVLTLLRALPGVHDLLVTVARRSLPASLTPAQGRQDHTASPSARAPIIRAKICTRCFRVHRVPRSTFGDDWPNAPLQSRRDTPNIPLICTSVKAKYFSANDLTFLKISRLRNVAVQTYAATAGLGQSRHFRPVGRMAASPDSGGIADIPQRPLGPTCDILRAPKDGSIKCLARSGSAERAFNNFLDRLLSYFRESHSRPPSEPFSIVLLKRTSAAVAMASFI